jgi:ketosteroid isomerase-like protein
MSPHVDHIRGLFEAISAGKTGDDLTAFFHPDAEQIEYPSLMRPRGHRRPLGEILEGSKIGASIVRDQRYDVENVVEQDDHVATQLTWTATTAVDLGAIPAGTGLVAHIAAYFLFREGRVLRLSSYDCYEPVENQE